MNMDNLGFPLWCCSCKQNQRQVPEEEFRVTLPKKQTPIGPIKFKVTSLSVSMSLSLCLNVSLSVCLHLSFCLNVSLCNCLLVFLSLAPSLYQSLCLSPSAFLCINL